MNNQHGGNIYRQPVRHDFSVNLNPLGTPDAVLSAARESIGRIDRYPDPQQTALRSALAHLRGIPEDWIVFGNGAAELIDAYLTVTDPKQILLPVPSFSEYRRIPELRGRSIRTIPMLPEEDFRLPVRRILDALDPSIDLLMLCNPNNPNGALAEPEALKQILARCLECKTAVFLDECFLPLSDHPEYEMSEVDFRSWPNLFVLRSFTKTFAMPGLRLGYGVSADPVLTGQIQRTLQPWNISIPAEAAGLAAVRTWDGGASARTMIREERTFLQNALTELGITVFPSACNYLLIRAREDLYDRLLSEQILIRDCSNYDSLGKGYFRIAVRTHAENLVLIKMLRCLL